MKKRKKAPLVCVGGYAGCGNLGDDAILSGILEGLFRGGVRPESIVVLSGKPRRDSRRFGVRCVGRKDPASVLFALLRADLFVSGGGTLLQTRTGRRSLFYYLALLRLARICGCRTVLLGGLGELSGAFARSWARKEMGSCSAILLRDERSAALAREMGVKNPNLTVGADSAFLLPAPPPLRAAFLQSRLVGDLKKPFLCVCPCGGVSTAALAAALRALPGFFPVFLLCHPSRDLAPARRLQKEFGGVLFSPREVSEAMALFSAASVTLSCRLHPLILSVRMGARCVCFSGGDPKLAAFCQSAGIPLFPAGGGTGLPSAAAFFSFSIPNSAEFCRMAAKDLAILCKMVYNEREESAPTKGWGKGRKIHEERAAGGLAPPDHH